MKVLVACEESQTVCKAFRAKGHEAFSCDILPPSGGHSEWHIQRDVREVLHDGWDMMIAHPPCTYLSRAGARWLHTKNGMVQSRYELGWAAKQFFEHLLYCGIPKIAVENPLPLKVYCLPKETQIIQPYQFGHPFSKRTHLWLKNLPPLIPVEVLKDFKPYLPSNTGEGRRKGQSFQFKNITQRQSSKTFEGIAQAMAEQWTNLIKPEAKQVDIFKRIAS